MRVIGIDPGLSACGVAITYLDPMAPLRSGKRIWDAFTIRTKQVRSLPTRALDIVGILTSAASPSRTTSLVIELPQVYQGYKQEGDPNDLIKLAVLVGAIIQAYPGAAIHLPTPTQWKGGVPKEIHHRRIREKVPGLGRQSKDALDAVGLALYGLERI